MRLYTHEDSINYCNFPHGNVPNWTDTYDTLKETTASGYVNALEKTPEFYRDIQVSDPFLHMGEPSITVSYQFYTELEYVELETLEDALALLTANPHIAICWNGETLVLDESPINYAV